MELEYISGRQLFCLCIFFLIGTSIILATTIPFSQQDGWIANILATLLSLVVVLVLSYLANSHPKKNLIAIYQAIFGKAIGTFIGLLYFLYALFLTALVLRNIADFLTTTLFEEDPIIFYLAVTALVVAYTLRQGIEVLARTCEFFFPFIALIFLYFLVIMFSKVRMYNLLPVASYGLLPIIKGSIVSFSFPFAELILLSMLLPKLEAPHKVFKPVFLATVAIAGVIFTISSVYVVGVFGPQRAAAFSFPIFSLVRMSTVEGLLERVEGAVFILWLVAAFTKACLCMFATKEIFCSLLNMQGNSKSIILPLLYFATAISFAVYGSLPEAVYTSVIIWPLVFSLPLGLAIPVVAAGISIIKKPASGAHK